MIIVVHVSKGQYSTFSSKRENKEVIVQIEKVQEVQINSADKNVAIELRIFI